MKQKLNILWLVLIIGLVTIVGCEMLQGPAGPEGPAGPAGDPAQTGDCLSCHGNDGAYIEKLADYSGSMHAVGSSWARGSSGSCARCHSNEGYQSAIETGDFNDGSDVAPANPTSVSCRTCHPVHEGAADGELVGDFSLRDESAVTLKGDFTGDVVVDLGMGNLCANCHQSRSRGYEDAGLDPAAGAGAYTITSSHFGPHHGTQVNFLTGIGLYEFDGTTYSNTDAHSNVTNACVSCHLSDHTFEPSIDSCTGCHTGLTTFDRNSVQTDFEANMIILRDQLVTAGVLEEEQVYEVNETTGAIELVGTGEYHPVQVATTSDIAGALFNYFGLLDDGSMGVHNPAYMEAILADSITATTP